MRCKACISDESLVRQVRKELKRQGLPPLGAKVPDGAPYAKKRRRAEKALNRIKKRAPKTVTSKTKNPPAVTTPAADATCPTCFVQLPATGCCDSCAS